MPGCVESPPAGFRGATSVSGAPENWVQALYAYNHSWSYVDEVLGLSPQLSGSTGV